MVSFNRQNDDLRSSLDRLLAKLEAHAEAAFRARREQAPAEQAKAPDFSGVVLVLRTRDGFERREQCPHDGPPPMWMVPKRPKPTMWSHDADPLTPAFQETRFRRMRWLSKMEVEYVED